MASSKPVLVLGGGAARALAHLGVLKALEAVGVKPRAIVGTSMGAVLGAAYAVEPDIDALIAKLKHLLTSEHFAELRDAFLEESKKRRGGLAYSVRNLVKSGVAYGAKKGAPTLVSAEAFANTLEALIPPGDLTDSEIPMHVVTLDAMSGEEIVFTKGDRQTICRASAAIPGILPPVDYEGRTLIDGGWIDKVPVLPALAKFGRPVFGVDISEALSIVEQSSEGLNLFVRANAIRDRRLVKWVMQEADLIVEPPVKEIHWGDFGALEHCIEAGLIAMQKKWKAFNESKETNHFSRSSEQAKEMASHLGIRWDV